jgi:hypothetical protein
LPPFRIFVSSPVDGIEDFRTAVKRLALSAEINNKFKFFFYEQYENVRQHGQTVCESIFASSGDQFDALFVFFKDRVGPGTIEELDYFENMIIPQNPGCQIWWVPIYCEQRSDDTIEFVGRLLAYGTELREVAGDEKIVQPIQLTGRLTTKLFSLV